MKQTQKMGSFTSQGGDEQCFGSWWVTPPRPGTADGITVPASQSGCTLPPIHNPSGILKPEAHVEETEAWYTTQLSYMK